MEGYILGLLVMMVHAHYVKMAWKRQEDIKHFMFSCDSLSLIRDNEMYLFCSGRTPLGESVFQNK